MGYIVLVHLKKERFLTDTYNKLKYNKIGPCIIIKKNRENAYHMDLIEEYDISPIFNVNDLNPYSGDGGLEKSV